MLNPASPELIAALRAQLQPAAFPDASDAFLREPRGRYKGHGVVVAPATTEDVALVMSACAAHRVAVVPHSGGTGLVGGQVMPDGPLPIILSLDRMRAIRGVYASENVLIAEAGVTLKAVQDTAQAAGRLFPLSLASEGSARVGGVLATNAGGVNVIRYGNARAQCLGLEVVTADGNIWHGLTRLRKDNAGYDLRDLLIGSEGSLGIITAAALKLAQRPEAEGAALMAVPSPKAALDLLAIAQSRAGEGVSAFELIHRQGLDFLTETGLGVQQPFTPLPDWFVLIDLGLSGGLSPDVLLEDIFVAAQQKDLVLDGVIARSAAQRAAFWRIRESIPEANRRIGAISSHDISVPLSEIPGFIEAGKAAISAIGPFRINCFGHLGDGNLHYNVFPGIGETREMHDDKRASIKTRIHDLVHERGGSVSAEHGVGRLKVTDLERYADPVRLGMMRAVKTAFDPQGILNPGVILRPA